MQARTSLTAMLLTVALGAPVWGAGLPDSAEHLVAQKSGDVTYLSGGVGKGERTAIEKQAHDYNLWVTLDRADGAYFSGVDVRIDARDGRKVLETTTNGPFLLAQLPPGSYEVRADAGTGPELRKVEVGPSGQTRVFMTLKDDATDRG